MNPRTNLDTLIVDGLNGEAEPFLLDLLKRDPDGDTLADPRRGKLFHIHLFFIPRPVDFLVRPSQKRAAQHSWPQSEPS